MSQNNDKDIKYGLPKGTWATLLCSQKKKIQRAVMEGTWDKKVPPISIFADRNISYDEKYGLVHGTWKTLTKSQKERLQQKLKKP
jgi:hypothetical protein